MEALQRHMHMKTDRCSKKGLCFFVCASLIESNHCWLKQLPCYGLLSMRTLFFLSCYAGYFFCVRCLLEFAIKILCGVNCGLTWKILLCSQRKIRRV